MVCYEKTILYRDGPRRSREIGISAFRLKKESRHQFVPVEVWAPPPVLSHRHKNLLIDHGGDLLSNSLLLSSSALVFCRSSLSETPGHLKKGPPRCRGLPARSSSRFLTLRRCDEWRKVAQAVLFARFQRVGEINGHAILQLLQNTK